MTLLLTPSQPVGPFFSLGMERDGLADLVRPETLGERAVIEGRVLDGDGVPAPDALLEFWQANAAGRYDHPADIRDEPLDPAFHGWGRALTGADGAFRLSTIVPGPVPGPGNALQAPHIAVTLFGRGLLRQLTTRLYFDGHPMNAADPLLSRLEEPDRATLMARPDGPGLWRFDIRLQGEGETLFLDV